MKTCNATIAGFLFTHLKELLLIEKSMNATLPFIKLMLQEKQVFFSKSELLIFAGVGPNGIVYNSKGFLL